MTYKEAYDILSGNPTHHGSFNGDGPYHQAMEFVMDMLKENAESAEKRPVPNPVTGLVPCGCGGKANIWPSDLRQAMVTAYQVGCIECAMTTVWVRGKQENAVKVWNRAMGYKEGAE